MEQNFKTLTEILKDRGYPIDLKCDEDNLEFRKENEITKICCKLKSRATKNTITETIENLIELDYQGKQVIIIIINETLTNSLFSVQRNIYKKYGDLDILLQIIPCYRIAYNIKNHSKYIKHEKLSEQEKQDLLKELFIEDENKLPKISINDSMSFYAQLKPGDVCRITRPSNSTGFTYYYRLCVFD